MEYWTAIAAMVSIDCTITSDDVNPHSIQFKYSGYFITMICGQKSDKKTHHKLALLDGRASTTNSLSQHIILCPVYRLNSVSLGDIILARSVDRFKKVTGGKYQYSRHSFSCNQEDHNILKVLLQLSIRINERIQ